MALSIAGLVAVRLGLSAIPLYIVAGIVLGPGFPEFTHVVTPGDGTELLSKIGIVLLLFFLGLEFSISRLTQARRTTLIGGAIDLGIAGGAAAVVAVVLVGPSAEAFILAGLIYISSSAIITRALFDFRRLADPETDLVLGVLVFEDLAIALFLGVAAALAAGDAASPVDITVTALIAILVVAAFLAASRYAPRVVDRMAPRLEREQLLIATLAMVFGSAALAEAVGLSDAIGALLAGVVLSETIIREDIERELIGLRDFAAGVFFFSFGLTVNLRDLDQVWTWLVAAVPVAVAGKLVAGYLAGRSTGFSKRRSLDAGAALIARGEFTIILSQLAAAGIALDASFRERIGPFAGMFVVVTTIVGVLFMKESRRIGRRMFRTPRRDTTTRSV